MDNNEFIHIDDEQSPQQPAAAQSRIVSPGRGFHWLERSLSEIVMPHFGKWFLAGLIFSVITTVIPMLGILFAMLIAILNPLLFAGGYIGAHKVHQHSGDISPYQFFEGFIHPQKFGLLVYCGVVAAIGIAGFYLFRSLIGVEQLAAINWQVLQMANDQQAAQAELQALYELLSPYLLWIFLFAITLALAGWFAPNLILNHQQNPLVALAQSLVASLKNILALIVLLLVLIACAIVAALALMLIGVLLNVLLPPLASELLINTLVNAIAIPIMAGVGYISYREVFLGDIKASSNRL